MPDDWMGVPVILSSLNARSRVAISLPIAASDFAGNQIPVLDVNVSISSPGMVRTGELPVGWGLLEYHNRSVNVARASARNLRTAVGFRYEMNLLLASLVVSKSA
jgi:hypothetical protein